MIATRCSRLCPLAEKLDVLVIFKDDITRALEVALVDHNITGYVQASAAHGPSTI
jgi:hypothetical protein